MRAVVPAPGKILLDEAGAMFLGGRGWSPKEIEKPWSRYPWATHQLDLPAIEREKAAHLATQVREYADFVESTA